MTQLSIMKRDIDSIDEATELVHLSCGHRIKAPSITPEQQVECTACDKFELPSDAGVYKKTPDFTEISLPDALRREHNTKRGVWGRIVVLEGRLRYCVNSLSYETELNADTPPGIIQPEVLHAVEPIGEVRFYVEFLRVHTIV